MGRSMGLGCTGTVRARLGRARWVSSLRMSEAPPTCSSGIYTAVRELTLETLRPWGGHKVNRHRLGWAPSPLPQESWHWNISFCSPLWVPGGKGFWLSSEVCRNGGSGFREVLIYLKSPQESIWQGRGMNPAVLVKGGSGVWEEIRPGEVTPPSGFRTMYIFLIWPQDEILWHIFKYISNATSREPDPDQEQRWLAC